MKSALLVRLGGLGDIIILTAVAKELNKRDYAVDLCAGSPTGDIEKLLGNTKIFRNIFAQTRHFTGLDVYKVNETDWAGVELLKTMDYDLVVDYKNSVELNSHYRHLAQGQAKEWFSSQNSNYANWYDIMLGWAGIDPETVSADDKRPVYVVEADEREWAKKLVGKDKYDTTIGIQLNASSLVRTWYSPEQLPARLVEEFPGKRLNVLFFDGAQWHTIRGKYDFPIVIPKQFDPIRASAALVEQCDLFVGADSGFSHLAEAMGVKSLTVYTTVPAWTRMKYYKYAKAIEPIGDTFAGVRCRPCFVLDRYCPRIREKALLELTPRELQIKEMVESGRQPGDCAKELSTTQQGVIKEWEMTQHRFNALIEMQAPCSATITPERIISAISEMI